MARYKCVQNLTDCNIPKNIAFFSVYHTTIIQRQFFQGGQNFPDYWGSVHFIADRRMEEIRGMTSKIQTQRMRRKH